MEKQVLDNIYSDISKHLHQRKRSIDLRPTINQIEKSGHEIKMGKGKKSSFDASCGVWASRKNILMKAQTTRLNKSHCKKRLFNVIITKPFIKQNNHISTDPGGFH